MKKRLPDGRPRIAHVLPWSAVGGTELGALRIADAVRDEFEAEAFCVPGAGAVASLFHDAGIETATYTPVEPGIRELPAFASATMALAREFRRRRVSLVHCADLLAGFHAAAAGRLAGLPVVCHIRCAFEHVQPRLRWFLRPVDRFVFVSRHTRDVFGLPVRSEHGTVIYDGIDIQDGRVSDNALVRLRGELGIPAGARVVGMVARVAPAKDFPTLIRAASQVIRAEPDTRFLIVGDHSSTPEYRGHFDGVRRLLAEATLADNFIFTGHRSDVGALLELMDLFVLSTHTEGLPLGVLEAMGRGKPVIATAVGGIPELVVHGRSGLLHDPGDDMTLAEQILRLLHNRRSATELGNSAATRVKEHFSPRQFAADLTSLYQELLATSIAISFCPRVG